MPEIGEYKTKPTQASVQHFSKKGLVPDLIVARTLDNKPVPQKFVDKLYNLLLIPTINVYNEQSLYNIPKQLLHITNYFSNLRPLVEYNIEKCVTVSIAGKYSESVDSYHSLVESLKIAGLNYGIKVNIVFNELDVDAIVVAGGFGSRGIEKKIQTLKHARENKIPCLGICLGMQCMILEYYRNILKINANSQEFSDTDCIIEGVSNSMIKGKRTVKLIPQSLIWNIYKGRFGVEEIFRHKYGIRDVGGLSATAFCGDIVAAVELEDHPFYLGVQYHPEFKGSLSDPHNLFVKFLNML